jgi:DNA-directed RNA polymerase subunit RPC12/RpoP
MLCIYDIGITTRQLTLAEAGVPVVGTNENTLLSCGWRITFVEGRKTYKCSNCGKEIRQSSKDNALDICPLCGGKMNALDFKIGIKMPTGEVWYPTFEELGGYFNSAKDRGELYRYMEQLYTNDLLIEVPEHEWFLKYLYCLFIAEDINYPPPIHEGRGYPFDFFKSIYGGMSIEDALKKYRLY